MLKKISAIILLLSAAVSLYAGSSIGVSIAPDWNWSGSGSGSTDFLFTADGLSLSQLLLIGREGERISAYDILEKLLEALPVSNHRDTLSRAKAEMIAASASPVAVPESAFLHSHMTVRTSSLCLTMKRFRRSSCLLKRIIRVIYESDFLHFSITSQAAMYRSSHLRRPCPILSLSAFRCLYRHRR